MAVLLPGNIVYGGDIDNRESMSYRSLGHYLLEKLKSFDDKIVLIDALHDRKYSARYLHDAIVRMARHLHQINIGRGDTVGMCCENSLEFAVILFAIYAVNATAATFNVSYSEGELNHAMTLSKPKIVFVDESALDRLVAVTRKTDFVKKIIVIADKSSHSSVLTYRDFMQGGRTESPADFQSQWSNKADDIALILCSSGTTGLPKGVQLTQENILNSLDLLMQLVEIPVTDVAVLSIIPWFHSFGCIVLTLMMSQGAISVFLPRFDGPRFLNAIEKYRVTIGYMVPPLMVFLAKHPLVDKYDLSSLELIFSGAAPLSVDVVKQVKDRIGVRLIYQGYGLSESTAAIAGQTKDACKSGSIGTLLHGIYAKVIDPETGANLEPNQRGELCFKGGAIMKGYINNTAETAAILKDGWLHSGDIGYYDHDCEFFIVDRLKELIKYKGYQVPPAELEAVLLSHSKINDAAVIGKPDFEAGELPTAFVVKKPGAHLTAKEVEEFVAERVSPAKKLRGGIHFVDEIPKNPSGKILRRVLRDQIGEKSKAKL